MATNFDIVVIDTAASNGISLTITGGNTVSIAASTASNNGAGVILGASNGAKIVNGIIQMDMTALSPATLTTTGVVQTRNAPDPQVTSASVSVVPTQYYVQQEVARLEVAIAGATGALRYEPINTHVES